MDERLGFMSDNGISFLEWVRIYDYHYKKCVKKDYRLYLEEKDTLAKKGGKDEKE
ncbi:hypothetical protein LCGC14_1293210 [marine sediment metagenome]|uniref:Uncharacterized protein n=1 Tax=marine sediment metagenome TaxID=412755 RepID=A0A0F9KTI0_9ZZZZ